MVVIVRSSDARPPTKAAIETYSRSRRSCRVVAGFRASRPPCFSQCRPQASIVEKYDSENDRVDASRAATSGDAPKWSMRAFVQTPGAWSARASRKNAVPYLTERRRFRPRGERADDQQATAV